MKPSHLAIAAALSAVMITPAIAGSGIVDRISGEELAARRLAGTEVFARVAPNQNDALPTVRPRHQGVIENSEVISNGQFWTIVPKGAVVHVPETMAVKVGGAPHGNYAPWIEFLGRNRAWLEAQEISMSQATGEEPFSDHQTELWRKNQRVVVAVHLAGPISVIRSRSETSESSPS